MEVVTGRPAGSGCCGRVHQSACISYRLSDDKSCVPLLGCHAATSKGLTRSCVIPGSNYRLDAHLLEDRDRVPRTLLISE